MAACSEINLMLGSFEDGELEPNEMQEVAFHLARCQACTDELSELSTIGRELRSLSSAPALAGFAVTVKERIDNLPVPFRVRMSRFFDRGFGAIGSGFAWGAAMAAVAAATTILISPYATRLASRHPETVNAVTSIARDAVRAPARLAEAFPDNSIQVASFNRDSHAVISRLEAEVPSVAVWNEPRTDTTVIWVPDQR
ncbi:MAG TPA: zf-HC2 domain-containing protein [Candidatus Binataceae bacterium]|nr:zf-HC2 domain-containing protein [Candidatus Binataceae bacterium]